MRGSRYVLDSRRFRIVRGFAAQLGIHKDRIDRPLYLQGLSSCHDKRQATLEIIGDSRQTDLYSGLGEA